MWPPAPKKIEREERKAKLKSKLKAAKDQLLAEKREREETEGKDTPGRMGDYDGNLVDCSIRKIAL